MIIDAHTHVGSHIYGSGVDRADPATLNVEYERRTEIMDLNGIDQAVLMPTYTYDKRDGTASTRALNERLAEIQAEFDRVAATIGTVEPAHGEAAIEELERLPDLGLRGVSWHHKYQGSIMDDPVTIDCLRRLAELDLVGFLHCFQTTETEDFERLDAVMEYTDQPIIALDSMTEALHIDRAIKLCHKYPNLYLDTAMLYPLGFQIERVVDAIGADRLVFGTAFYTSPLQYQHSATLFKLRNADLDAATREKILGENIQRLLNLPVESS